MIDFMVIALPRSGTTWAANWLTTDRTHCIHDPLYTTSYRDWDHIGDANKMMGVSCTGIWRKADWLNAHPARKVILHRSLDDVNRSMARIGLPEVEAWAPEALRGVQGLHIEWSGLFEPDVAAGVWRHLTGLDFDAQRHRALCEIEMQPKFAGLSIGPEVTRSFVQEVQAILRGGA